MGYWNLPLAKSDIKETCGWVLRTSLEMSLEWCKSVHQREIGNMHTSQLLTQNGARERRSEWGGGKGDLAFWRSHILAGAVLLLSQGQCMFWLLQCSTVELGHPCWGIPAATPDSPGQISSPVAASAKHFSNGYCCREKSISVYVI